MKKIGVLLLICAMLWGCAAAPTFETLGDVLHQQAGAVTDRKIQLDLPADAVSFGDAYFCGDYYLEVQTVPSGDINGTIRTMSGYCAEDLTLMTAATDDYHRYEWVWSAAGEEGEVICRAAVIDDGNYHYCLTAVAPAEKGGALADAWNTLFSSFEAT